MISRKELINKRMNICKECPELTKVRTCKKCGCFMPAKIRLASATCPLNKWNIIARN